MYVKPDSTALKARVARAGEAMDAAPDAALGPRSYGPDGPGLTGVRRDELRNDNVRGLDPRPAEPREVAPARPDAGRPSREEAEAAVRTLLRWTGDDPDREGLVDTPARVVKAYEQLFSGYGVDADALLGRVFEEVEGYTDIVVVRDIPFHSHCEHHMVPFTGLAHVAYYPEQGVVGLSKLARVVDVFAKRLQTQEAMTAQIADAIESVLKPRGVAVMLEAEHLCMAMRGVQKAGVSTVTSQFRGVFRGDPTEQVRFLTLVRGAGG